jgi:hypothetical protein
LKIVGYKDVLFGTGYYYILATFHSVKPIIIQRISFMVDTGCQITTISPKDSLSFYADVPAPSTWTMGASGSIETSVIFNCGVSFDLVQSTHLEKIAKIHILYPDINMPAEDFKKSHEGTKHSRNGHFVKILSKFR